MVMSMSVCVFVCMSVCKHISETPCQTFTKSSVHIVHSHGSILHVCTAKGYVLPVLWMTSCLLIQARVTQIGCQAQWLTRGHHRGIYSNWLSKR